MKKFHLILLFFINLFIINTSSVSEIIKYPLPEITNYPPSINGGQTQTWDITQGKDGKLYFANSYGLLIYDGKQWKSLLLDNKYSARSISVDQVGNIVIGSRGDFGFISNDGNGNIKFLSLKVFSKCLRVGKSAPFKIFFLLLSQACNFLCLLTYSLFL